MKKLISIISLSLISILAICQKNEIITVATLTPKEVIIPKNLTKLVEEYQANCIQPARNFITQKYDSLQDAIENNPNLSPNHKSHLMNQIASATSLNIAKEYSLNKAESIQEYLSYKQANILALYNDIKSSGELESLKEIADSLNVRYLVNFPYIKFLKVDGQIAINSRTQLYDKKHHAVIIDEETEYTNSIDWSTKQTCEFNNKKIVFFHSDQFLFRQILFSILNDRSEELIKEKNEQKEREIAYLANFERVKEILIENSVPTTGLIGCLLMNGGSKFMAYKAISSQATSNKCTTRYTLIVGVKNDNDWSFDTLSSNEIHTDCDKEATERDVFNNLNQKEVQNFLKKNRF